MSRRQQVQQPRARTHQQQQQKQNIKHNLLTHKVIRAEQESVPPTFDRLTDILSQVTPKTSFETIDILYESVFLNLTRMNEEDWRLRSFVLWFPPLAWVAKEELALAGFYYSGRGDTVVCFSCSTRLNNWKWDDIPWSEHKRHSANCKLVTGQEPSNKPLDTKLRDPMIFKNTLDQSTTRLQEFLKSEAEKKSNAEADNGAVASHSFAYESSSTETTELKDGASGTGHHHKQTQKQRDDFDPIKAVAAAIHFPNTQNSPLISREDDEELPTPLREDGVARRGNDDLERDGDDDSHTSGSGRLQSVSARRKAKYMSTTAARSIMMLDYSEDEVYQAVKRLRRKKKKVPTATLR